MLSTISCMFKFDNIIYIYSLLLISEIIGFILSVNYKLNIGLIFMFYTFFVVDISIICLLFLYKIISNLKIHSTESKVEDNIITITIDGIKRLIKQDYEKDCSICLDEIRDIKILECGHYFCNECITKSLSVNNKCPICRVINV